MDGPFGPFGPFGRSWCPTRPRHVREPRPAPRRQLLQSWADFMERVPGVAGAALGQPQAMIEIPCRDCATGDRPWWATWMGHPAGSTGSSATAGDVSPRRLRNPGGRKSIVVGRMDGLLCIVWMAHSVGSPGSSRPHRKRSPGRDRTPPDVSPGSSAPPTDHNFCLLRWQRTRPPPG